MARSLKKGPFVDSKLLARIEKMNEENKKEVLKTFLEKNKRLNDIRLSKKDTEFASMENQVSSKKLVDMGKELLKRQTINEKNKDL